MSPPWSDPQREWAPSHRSPLLLSWLTRPAASGQACYCHGNHMRSRPGGTMSETAWSIWEGNWSLRANLRWKGQGTVVPCLTKLTLMMSRVALKVTQYHTFSTCKAWWCGWSRNVLVWVWIWTTSSQSVFYVCTALIEHTVCMQHNCYENKLTIRSPCVIWQRFCRCFVYLVYVLYIRLYLIYSVYTYIHIST